MGAPEDIISFLSKIYARLSAKIRYGIHGECKKHFNITHGIRQGCTLAPLLFSLHINGVDILLQNLGVDVPMIGKRATLLLLYVDDAVLISRTANGLQSLMDNFTRFMTENI